MKLVVNKPFIVFKVNNYDIDGFIYYNNYLFPIYDYTSNIEIKMPVRDPHCDMKKAFQDTISFLETKQKPTSTIWTSYNYNMLRKLSYDSQLMKFIHDNVKLIPQSKINKLKLIYKTLGE